MEEEKIMELQEKLNQMHKERKDLEDLLGQEENNDTQELKKRYYELDLEIKETEEKLAKLQERSSLDESLSIPLEQRAEERERASLMSEEERNPEQIEQQELKEPIDQGDQEI